MSGYFRSQLKATTGDRSDEWTGPCSMGAGTGRDGAERYFQGGCHCQGLESSSRTAGLKRMLMTIRKKLLNMTRKEICTTPCPPFPDWHVRHEGYHVRRYDVEVGAGVGDALLQRGKDGKGEGRGWRRARTASYR